MKDYMILIISSVMAQVGNSELQEKVMGHPQTKNFANHSPRLF